VGDLASLLAQASRLTIVVAEAVALAANPRSSDAPTRQEQIVLADTAGAMLFDLYHWLGAASRALRGEAWALPPSGTMDTATLSAAFSAARRLRSEPLGEELATWLARLAIHPRSSATSPSVETS
jgi:hypothetical protein